MRRALILLRRRLIGAVPVLLLVVIGTFFLLEAAGGDAVDAYIVSTGGDAGLIEALRQRWGLDQSAITRLANYLWALVHLDLGWSVTFSRPILDVIRERLPNTLLLMGSATALSFSSRRTIQGMPSTMRCWPLPPAPCRPSCSCWFQ